MSTFPCPVCELMECALRVQALEASSLPAQQKVLAGYDLYRAAVASVLRHHGYASALCRTHASRPRDIEPTLSDADKRRAADRQVSLFAAELRARR